MMSLILYFYSITTEINTGIYTGDFSLDCGENSARGMMSAPAVKSDRSRSRTHSFHFRQSPGLNCSSPFVSPMYTNSPNDSTRVQDCGGSPLTSCMHMSDTSPVYKSANENCYVLEWRSGEVEKWHYAVDLRDAQPSPALSSK